MSVTSNSRRWSIFSLFLAIVFIPFLLARLLFDVNQFEIGTLFALFGLFIWIVAQGAGWRPIDRDSVVILNDAMGGASVYSRGSYLFIPIIHKVGARLPTYPFRFELTIQNIDTQTPMLARINRITVRLDCKIKDGEHLKFIKKSASRLDSLRALQESTKLGRTDHALWKRFLEDVIRELVDDAVRDVVWSWPDPATNDPTGLSKQRRALAFKIEDQLSRELAPWGLTLLPFHPSASVAGQTPRTTAMAVVLESIEVDPEVVRGKMRNYNIMLTRATEEASIQAASIREKGFAEAEVRARALGLLLDELVTKRGMAMNDPLVAQVVRAALYSDGEMIWRRVADKGDEGKKG